MSQIQEFDFSVDLLRALLWQYNEATRLQTLMQGKQDWYNINQTEFWGSWYRDVFNLQTANDFGLAVWAIILDIPLLVASQGDPIDKPIWGFGQYRKNFENGNFASIATSQLTTEQKRLVLRLRYFQLYTRATVTEVNAFLGELFAPYGGGYVQDNLDMTALYIFNSPLPSALAVVLSEFDLLPRPAGVKIDFIITGLTPSWGFGEFHRNFENGNFHHA